MGRDDFVSSKKKSAFLGKAKKGGKGSVFGGGDEGESSNEGLQKQFYSLMDSIVFKDELVAYLSSVINNTEPNEYVYDEFSPIYSLAGVPVGQPTLLKITGGTPGIKTWSFDKSTEEQLFFHARMPHSYMEGTNLIPHVHWAPADAGTGNVIWGLEYAWINQGSAVAGPTTITTTQAGAGVADVIQHVSFTAITGTGKTIMSTIFGRFYRDADAVGDTYDDEAALLSFDFIYQKDSRGSATAGAK